MRDNVSYHIEDIRSIDSIDLPRDFDTVYHLAALARIQPSFKDPAKYFSIDAFGTCKVLEFARKCGAKFVYAGSSSAYAGPMLNPYAFAKFTGEELCRMYSNVYGMSTVIARFFNVYGDRQPTSGPYATVVGIFEGQTLNDEKLTVTGNGNQRRDFTHISDIVTGFELLAHQNFAGEIYQLGTGKNYSINELASFFGGDVEYIMARPGEAWSTLADHSEFSGRTGWKPTTDIKEYVDAWKERNALSRE
jgi:UDP-glucose 4-epimerase